VYSGGGPARPVPRTHEHQFHEDTLDFVKDPESTLALPCAYLPSFALPLLPSL